MSRPLLLRKRCALAVKLFLSMTIASAAFASQGPGASGGTASASTQLAMAIIIYGGVSLILAASLTTALKRRFSRR
jgi:hypothetical protein